MNLKLTFDFNYPVKCFASIRTNVFVSKRSVEIALPAVSFFLISLNFFT